MSMLSSMTDKLRTTASEVKRVKDNNADWLWRDAITLNDAVRELCDAADTIDYLCVRCNDLQAENNGLWESYDNVRNAMWDRAHARAIQHMTEDELRGLCADLYDYVDGLKALVRDMWMCAERDCMCHGCPLRDDERCDFEGRMESLGIEVDDDD